MVSPLKEKRTKKRTARGTVLPYLSLTLHLVWNNNYSLEKLRARIVSLDMRQWREFVRIFGMEEPMVTTPTAASASASAASSSTTPTTVEKGSMVKRRSNGVVDDADDGGEGSDNTVENILHVSVE